jgi:large subunit ribosomal protein L22
MDVQAKSTMVRISPIKIRDIARTIRGKMAEDAMNTLTFTPRKSAKLLAKTLKSAMANAENNNNLSVSNLVISEVLVDEGPSIKRFKAAARGSAHRFKRRTTHITIVLSELPEESENAGE